MKKQNPNCDGGHCQSTTGEVRVYPLGSGANAILCRDCWEQENRYTVSRGFEALDWAKAKVYGEDKGVTKEMREAFRFPLTRKPKSK